MSKTSPKVEQVEIVPVVEEPQIPPDLRHIRISIRGFKNIVPLYLVSELEVKVSYIGEEKGTSARTAIIDDEFITVNNDLEHEFVIPIDINSAEEIDRLISNPVLLNVIEIPGSIDEELLQNLQVYVKPTLQEIRLSAESEADLAEAFGLNQSEIARKGSKVKSESKTDKSEITIKSVKEETVKLPMEQVSIGVAVLDLLPLFFGKIEITENLPINQTEKYYDECIIPHKILPSIAIYVTIDEVSLGSEDHTNILSLTIESIYNIPNLFLEDMSYCASTYLPNCFGKWKDVPLKGGLWKNTLNPDRDNMKKWPAILDTFGITTKYRVVSLNEDIKNTHELNLEVMSIEQPRIEWNIIKRFYLKEEANREFLMMLKKFRRLPLEIYISSAKPESPTTLALKKASSTTSDKKKEPSKKGSNVEKEVPENFLHLMAFIDITTLLYPGVKKCRVACPLNTFQKNEIFEIAGLEKSYFVSKKPEEPIKVPIKAEAKDSKKIDLAALLPTAPLVLEPSKSIYNENGQRTYVIIEVELTDALVAKQSIEDLSESFFKFIPQVPEMPKSVITSYAADAYFKDVMKQLTEDLTNQHKRYLQKNELCKCENKSEDDEQATFISYLHKTGIYETYLTSITKATSAIVNDKFAGYLCDVDRDSKQYQNVIAEIYSYLVKHMNKVLNQLTNLGTEDSPPSSYTKLDSMLLYAKEACELEAIDLADRYFLEHICTNEKEASYWFDYAVFQLELGNIEKALECVKKGLSFNNIHKYCLLMCAILFSMKQCYKEAETCLLSTIFHYQTWTEGWGVMHLFYFEIGNSEGADLALEMGRKYLREVIDEKDYVSGVDDLIWTAEICPNTLFFKTATLLIKMRLFGWAEKAIVHELTKYVGVSNYCLAVIAYYRHNYQQALVCVKEAEESYGADYAVISLKGHCYMRLDEIEKAKQNYLQTLEYYNRPKDIHMVYVFLALILEKLNNSQASRKFLLLACKYSPTPYTWLSTGLLFYRQGDFLSAEQCLTLANVCDNRLPEIWAYLTLINLELDRIDEAELCFRQAKKNNLKNDELRIKIEELFKVKKITI